MIFIESDNEDDSRRHALLFFLSKGTQVHVPSLALRPYQNDQDRTKSSNGAEIEAIKSVALNYVHF